LTPDKLPNFEVKGLCQTIGRKSASFVSVAKGTGAKAQTASKDFYVESVYASTASKHSTKVQNAKVSIATTA
jgi:hypothetical protein